MGARTKSEKDIKILKEGGQKLSSTLGKIIELVRPGLSAFSLELEARRIIKEYGGRPSFLNYRPDYTSKPFPAALCVSVNETIVHGLPKKNLIFKPGDVVSLDIGMKYKGLFTDMAYTVVLGKASSRIQKLVGTVRKSLGKAIKKARIGNYVGDISSTIEKAIKKEGFFPICELTGHGVGYAVHEEPYVLNCGEAGAGLELKEGLVLALEPMTSLGTGKILQMKDDSFRTLDGSVSAHFEQTVAITKKGPVVITPFLWER